MGKEKVRFKIPEIHGAEAIKRIAEVFDKHKTRFWLDYGTLLGKVREDRFIPHDGDIDIAIDYDNWNQAVLEDLPKNGIYFKKPYNRFTDDRILKFVGDKKKNTITQLKLAYRYKNKHGRVKAVSICGEVYHRGVGKYKDMMYFWPTPKPKWIFHIPWDYMVPQIETTFYGTKVYIPKNYEDNLKFMYGEDWRIDDPLYKNSDKHRESGKRFKLFFM